MHIPDGFLTPQVWGGASIVSGAFLAFALRRLNQTLEEKAIPLMGVLAAFVFAGQMINLPVGGGTSAHFLGGTLVSALLGPWGGLVVMAVVLMVQCFIFQDGGVAALGTNIFILGVIGSMAGGILFQALRRIIKGKRSLFWSGFIASWLAVVASAISCAFILSTSHVVSFKVGMSLIGGVHVLFGLVEGFVTGTVLETIANRRPDLLKEKIS